MKTLCFFLFMCVALVKGKATLNVPPEYAGDILKATTECIQSTGIGPDAVQKVLSPKLENSEPFKKFLYCFSFKSGYIDSNGHFIVDQMIKLIGNYKEKAKFIDIVNLCNKNEGGNPLDTMFLTTVCFKENSPVNFTL